MATMQTQFADAIARTEAEARLAMESLEEEKTYQESRNSALQTRNRQLYNQIQDLKVRGGSVVVCSVPFTRHV